MVRDHEGEQGSQWLAIQSIAVKIGCSGEALRNWVRQSERDQAADCPARLRAKR
jgi:transposase